METKWTTKLANRAREWGPARIAFVLYAVLTLPIYCLPVCTPDEIWFSHDAKMFADAWRGQTFLQAIFGQENHLGYGAIYWLWYAALAKITTHHLVAMRCVSYLANLTIPLLLLRESRDSSRRPAATCAMLLWFTFTAAWWTGKTTGPELISMSVVFGGLYCLSKASRLASVFCAGVLLGLGIGLKSNAAPAALCMLFILPQIPRPWRSLCVVVFATVVGFVAANPFVMFDPTTLLANIRRPDKFGAGYTTNHIAEIFWNRNWEWDGVFRGGYFNWGLSPLALPIYLWFLWRSKLPWNWMLGGIACTVAGSLLYLTSRSYQGWYWLPLLSLFPLTVMQLRNIDSKTWRMALIVIAVNLVCNAPWIGMQYYSKCEQFAHSFDRERVLDEAKRIATSPRDGLLVTILDQGVELEKRDAKPTGSGAEVVTDLSGFFLLNELRFGSRELVPGETWVVIHDHRLRQYNPILDPARDTARLGPDYEVELSRGEFVTSMRIHRRLQTAKKGEDRR